MLFLLLFAIEPSAVSAQVMEKPSSVGTTSELHTIESNGPEYQLNPVSNTADLNLLAGIFGKIARAAAGQIPLSDVLIGTDPDGSKNTDNVLAAMMFVYLAGILAITAIVIVILIGLMTIQSGKEGSVLTQRYNEWVAVRTLYALFAMMPVLGGWSIGQYAILNGTFFVNSIANEMNHVGSRWVYANGTTNSIDLDPFKYRNLVENVYLNEICAQLNNDRVKKTYGTISEYLTAQTHRLASGKISESTSAALEKSIELISFRSQEESVARNSIQNKTIISPFKNYYQWSSPAMGDSVCGEIVLDYTSLDSENLTVRNIEVYFDAHDTAILALLASAKADISEVLGQVNNIDSSIPFSEKDKRKLKLSDAADASDAFAAFAFAFDDLAELRTEPLERLLSLRTTEYIHGVSEKYKTAAASYAALFDDLLNEIAKLQRNSGVANYQNEFTSEDLKSKLDPKFHSLIGPEIDSLLVNTSRGWMYGGFKWWDLSKAQTRQYALQAASPNVISFTRYMSGISNNVNEKIMKFAFTYAEYKEKRIYTDYIMTVDGKEVSPDPLTDDSFIQASSSGDMRVAKEKWSAGLGPWITQGMTGMFMQDLGSTDLLSNLQSAGHKYLWIADSMYLAVSSANILSKATQSASHNWLVTIGSLGTSRIAGDTARAIVKELVKPLSFLASIFLVVGFLYAVYLPLLPAMIWVFTIIGWLEKLISLIIIFPIWMLGHVFPEGDGLINGVGRQGYVLAANVLLRPPVALLALHFAMATLGAIGFVINHVLAVFLPSANSAYTTGITVGVGGFVVLSGFMVVVCHSILSWIYKIPDEIPHYIGGGGANFGESEGKGHLHAIAGMISHQGQSVGSALMGSGENPNGKPRRQRQRGTKQGNKYGSMGA